MYRILTGINAINNVILQTASSCDGGEAVFLAGECDSYCMCGFPSLSR